MKRVLFIVDRAAHYHVDLLHALEARLRDSGLELHLASGIVAEGATGRVGFDGSVLANELKYEYTERAVLGRTLRRVRGLPHLVAQVSPHVVICTAHVGNLSHWQLALSRRRMGFRLVAWQCGYMYRDSAFKRWLLRRFVPRFDHHLAYHSNARDYALRHGATASQVTVMHNTINERRIQPMPKEEALALVRAMHPAIGARKIVLFVGALLEEKRVEVIFKALDLLRRDDLMLLVVGDGPHRGALQGAAAVRDDVVFAGAVVDGVGPYFDAATMFVMPGTGGLGLNEAMAHGLPMLSGYADGSADDLVIDGETGYRLRDGSAAELATRMRELLENTETAAEMSRRALALITDKFSFRNFVECIAHVVVSEARLSR